MQNVLKRIGAYIIDIVIVSIVTTLLSNTPLNPKYDEYTEVYESNTETYSTYSEMLNTLSDAYKDEKITSEEVSSFEKKYPDYTKLVEKYYKDEKIDKKEYDKIYEGISSDYNKYYEEYFYRLNMLSLYTNIMNFVAIILYFVIFQFIAKGQTLGKRLFRLQVKSAKEGKDLNMGNYMLRSLLLNGLAITLIDNILLFTVNQTAYMAFNKYLYLLSYLIEISIIIMVGLREDNRGLHDVLGGTRVAILDKNGEGVLVKPVQEQPKEIDTKVKEAKFTETGKKKKKD